MSSSDRGFFSLRMGVAALVSVVALIVLLRSRGLFIAAAIAETASSSVAPTPAAYDPEKGENIPGYPAIGIRAGVYNDGQAAIWDLDIIDYFRRFGAKERARGYRPEQPIAFSHITHVQKNKMECQYCHWSVAKAAYAAIPEVQACWGCHMLIKGQNDFQKKEIAKIEEAWTANKPIAWQKVHVMPSYVHFNHKRHVKAGIGCQNCHGQIPEMPVVERVSSMKMGWCVSCHRLQGASVDCYTCHY